MNLFRKIFIINLFLYSLVFGIENESSNNSNMEINNLKILNIIRDEYKNYILSNEDIQTIETLILKFTNYYLSNISYEDYKKIFEIYINIKNNIEGTKREREREFSKAVNKILLKYKTGEDYNKIKNMYKYHYKNIEEFNLKYQKGIKDGLLNKINKGPIRYPDIRNQGNQNNTNKGKGK